jgi:hypothetical protein
LLNSESEKFIHFPNWSNETKETFQQIFKKYKIDEVIDIGEVLDVKASFPDESYYETVKAMLSDPE